MEQQNQLRDTTLGRVEVRSGKLLIIDPCYLEPPAGAEIRDAIAQRFNAKFDAALNAREESDDSFARVSEDLDVIIRRLLTDIPEDSKGDCESADEPIGSARFEKNEPAHSPLRQPLVQAAHYVYVHNPTEVGFYPVVRSQGGRMRIVYNYPTKGVPGCSTARCLDRSRLRGRKLIGMATVNCGTQILTDADNFKIDPTIAPACYCVLKVKPGVYRCSFENDGDALVISRAQAQSQTMVRDEGLSGRPRYAASGKPKGMEALIEECIKGLESKARWGIRFV